MKYNTVLILLALCLCTQLAPAQKKKLIIPGAIWPDQKGNHIQAHGGAITKVGNTYYWYGEQRGKGLEPAYRYVSCYRSRDLMNWSFKGNVLKLKYPDTLLKNWVLERPKVFYNRKHNNYVMYMHIDGNYVGRKGDYNYAKLGVAVSDKATGPFKFIRSFRPFGNESRDIGQFIDDDGTAYLIYENRARMGFHIARLSEDYQDVEKDICFIRAAVEGGAVVKYDGLYYALGSALTGWDPNPNKYATSRSLAGPWSEFKDIAPPQSKTYQSQSTYLLKVAGSKGTSVIFMGDQWHPEAQWDSRYLWMPVEISDGTLKLPEPRPWNIDVKTGLVTFPKQK